MPGGGGGGLQLSCHGNDIAMGRQAKRLWGFPARRFRNLVYHRLARKPVAIFVWRAGPILLEREAALFISPRTRAELATYKMPDGSLDVASAPAMAASMSAARRASLIKLFHSIDLDGNGCNARNCRAITAQLWCNSLTRLHTSLQRDRPQ